MYKIPLPIKGVYRFTHDIREVFALMVQYSLSPSDILIDRGGKDWEKV